MPNNANDSRKLGTFLGVFTPTILTILGVIMYLRSGWLVGHLGLAQALLVVVVANAITLTTTLSFSSVTTNAPIGIGGAYFLISRSLGLAIGGSVGWPLFFSQVFSVTLYSFGLAESLRIVWPGVPVQEAAFVIVLGVSALSLLGAERALRSQIPLMVFIGISILAFAVGALLKAPVSAIPFAGPSGEVGFWGGFAVFFPAVTGVMAGLALSGDLRDPERSIPVGSLLAVATGFVLYMAVPILLAVAAEPETLRANPMIWSRIAPLGPWLIMPGLWGAIFSSAVGSMLAAPRTLQALAIDGLLPRAMGRRTGSRRDLVPGFAASIVIALAAVFLGNLNAVAPVVTMFFLTVYGTLNIVAVGETLSGDPSWRPKFSVPWPVSLIGGLACLATMFLIHPLAGLLAFLAEVSLWLFLSRNAGRETWGDARRGLYQALIRWALFRLAHRPMSARNWRPHPLVFVPEPVRHLDLIRFGNWFSQGRGLVTVCQLIVGDLRDPDLDLPAQHEKMQELLDREGLPVFADVNVVADELNGIVDVAQASGMASIESNLIMLGWPRRPERLVEFMRILIHLERLNKSLVIGRVQPRFLFPRAGTRREIHIWWGGLQRNGDLMLLLAHLLTRNHAWHDARAKVLSVASNELMATETSIYLQRLIAEIRIDAEVKVIPKKEGLSITQLIHAESADADVVFFGLATPEPGREAAYAERITDLSGELPAVFFVKNSSCFIGELVRPQEEAAGQE